jgi:glycosyltransferase involved in cell wall biosynthesis
MIIFSPINQLGYGIAGLNIVKELSKTSNVSLFCIGQPQVTNQEDANIISNCLRQGMKFDANDTCIKIWHQNDMAQFIGKGEHIGFPFFELDEFNDIEKHHLSSLDRIFVSSQWAKEVILDNISFEHDKINIIPLGVDRAIFHEHETINQSSKTIFFNCGKWEVRKGHDILCDIFNLAFDYNDDVELWMMCQNPFLSEQQEKEWINLYKNSKLGDKIRLFPRMETQEQVYNIMKETDCGIFPSRAEGWNLELLEMLSCGKHVITTNYAAHTEFCNTENALLVDVQEKEIAFDGKWFHGKFGKWAKIGQTQIEQFVENMKYIHTLKQNQKLSTNINGVNTSKSFTWGNTAKAILKYV